MEYRRGIDREWLIGNGLGGYSSSTVLGCNTRKYHGLLVASLDPPVKRRVLLSKLEEEIEVDDKIIRLSTNEYTGAVYPEGYKILDSFDSSPFPIFNFTAGDITISKSLFSLHGFNAVVFSYEVQNPQSCNLSLRIRPLITSRGIHEIGASQKMHIEDHGNKFYSSTGETFLGLGSFPGIWMASSLGEGERWYRNILYRLESERGYPASEDLYCPGEFVVYSGGNTRLFILAAGGGVDERRTFDRFFKKSESHYAGLQTKELDRINKLADRFRGISGFNESLMPLAVSSDSFVVRRDKPSGKSIIAGYHWFSDFGRDTFISLPGLLLVPERFDAARDVISTYGDSVRDGLVPNNFSEDGEPNYWGVDSSLWYVYAVQKYLEYSGDLEFVNMILPRLEEILEGYLRGNALAKADGDGLLSVERVEFASTWMDVNLDGSQATPRYGRVVEINALWYNSLRFMSGLDTDLSFYPDAAKSVKKNFSVFWNKNMKCLFDFISSDTVDDSIRPNQIFAVSLPYSPLDRKTAKSVVSTVEDRLLTPYGLRSLDPNHPGYHPVYSGDTQSRDSAYHQGTVWSWLLGPYISAYLRVNKSKSARNKAKTLLNPIIAHLSDAGIGSISEIFDGDPPHTPRGCISQAWSVGEILRAWYEDILGNRPEHQRGDS